MRIGRGDVASNGHAESDSPPICHFDTVLCGPLAPHFVAGTSVEKSLRKAEGDGYGYGASPSFTRTAKVFHTLVAILSFA